jgi:glucokinase
MSEEIDLYCGVDLGGTSVKAGIANEQGVVIARRSIPTQSHAGPIDVIRRIGDLILSLVEPDGAAASGVLKGIGIGVPGQVDIATGTTRFLPNLPTQWRDLPLASLLSQRLRCPVRVLNDARTATLGELRHGHGAGKPHLSLAFFTLGTGVGGGVAIDGKLRLGPLGAAGELGHQTVIADGARCGCGNLGCLETIASGPAIAAEGIKLMRMGLAPHLFDLVGGQADQVTTRQMAIAAQRDRAIEQAIVRAASYLGIAAANVVTMLHPDLIVIGGGVAEIGELLLDTVRQVMHTRVGMFPTDDVRVEQSMLGDQAGLIGAVALAREELH